MKKEEKSKMLETLAEQDLLNAARKIRDHCGKVTLSKVMGCDCAFYKRGCVLCLGMPSDWYIDEEEKKDDRLT